MKLLLAVTGALCALLTFAQTPNTWSDNFTFVAGQRDRAVAFTLNNRGYVACGEDTANNTFNDLWRFDPQTKIWSQMSSLPGSPRRNAVAFTIEDAAYVGTGVDSASAPAGSVLKDFWKYNPQTNSWSSIADYPGGGGNGVYYATAFSNNTKGYVCGGKIGPDSYLDELWEYKPIHDQWIQRAGFPAGARYLMSGFCINDMAYLGLGANEDIYLKDWWTYNTNANTWTAKGDFPSAERGGAVAFTIGSRGFISMGTDGGYKDDLWEYDPASDTWMPKKKFPAPGRKFACAFVIGDTAYLGLGKAATGRKRSFYRYYPDDVLRIPEISGSVPQVYPVPIESCFRIDSNRDFDRIILLSPTGRQLPVVNGVSGHDYQIREGTAPGTYLLLLTKQGEAVTRPALVVIR